MDRRLSIAFIVLLCLALLRYVAVACFVHPFADDFSYAVAGMHNDLLPRLWDEYRFWNGRWFSNVLVLRGPLVLGIGQGLWLYRAVPVVLLALTWCGAFSLSRAVAPALGRSCFALGASLFLLLYLQLMPDLSEGIYWYTGAVSYQLPGVLTLFLLARWMNALGGSGDRMPRTVGSSLLAALICGCSELHMVFMILLHIALLLVRWRSAGKLDRSLVIVLAVVLVAAAIMVFAPGNAGRGGQFPHKHDFLRSVGWGALQTARFLTTWILSPALLLVSVLYLLSARWLRDRVPLIAQGFGLGPWSAIALIVVPVFIAMVLPYWATGLLGQHRTVNATLLLMLPLWFIALTSIDRHWLRGRRSEKVPMVPQLRAIACTLLCVVVFATANGGRVTSDLRSGRLTRFDGELRARYAIIEEAKASGRTELVLPELVDRPQSLRFNDVTADPGHWINRSVAQYFGADSLLISIGALTGTATAPQASR